MQERIITLSDAVSTSVFYGVNNQNLIAMRNMCAGLKIVARGYQIKVAGNEAQIEQFVKLVQKAEDYVLRTGRLNEQILISLRSDEELSIEQNNNIILYGAQGRAIEARNKSEQELVSKFEDCDLLFAVGPAGSGKTYTAIALAVRALKQKTVRKIILSRPAIEAGEKLGFLPGDMREKIDPYLQPLYDALEDMVEPHKLQEYMDRGIVQIAPLAFMRGRTLSNAIVILDEAQNATRQQLKMFLTRLGMGAKMIITGDMTQIDLPQSYQSGLSDALTRLQGIEQVAVVRFSEKDIVRHPLVSRIVRAYDSESSGKNSTATPA